MAKNFLFQPNTPRLYIGYLKEIGNVEFDPDERYDIGLNLTPKTAKAWFATRRIDELTEWLN